MLNKMIGNMIMAIHLISYCIPNKKDGIDWLKLIPGGLKAKKVIILNMVKNKISTTNKLMAHNNVFGILNLANIFTRNYTNVVQMQITYGGILL